MRSFPSLLLVAALSAVAGTALARQHEHATAPAKAAPAAAAAQRYATDAILREEMKGIRNAVEALGHYEMGHMGETQAVEFATEIEGRVRTIVANCKLAPDADAALHAIIVPLAREAGALRQDPKQLAPIAGMREALAAYDRQFQDP